MFSLRRAGCPGVLDVLRDWSALDLLEPFLWVSSDFEPGAEVAALKITGGLVSATTVQAEAADRRYQQRRVAVLVPVADDPAVPAGVAASSAAEQRISGLLEAAGSTTRIRLLIARGTGSPDTAALARLGWHNILLSPEDAEGPGKNRARLGPAGSTVDLGVTAAAGVAGLTGLWRGIDSCPLDGIALPPAEFVRLGRSFYRRVRTDEVEHRLRARVTSMANGVPLPHRSGAACVPIEDIGSHTGQLADQVFARHPGVLKGNRFSVAAQSQQQIGALAILRLFFAFLLAAVRNAPVQWYRSTVAKLSSAAARTVHSAVFGQTPVAYETVVNGMTAQGVPANWAEWAAATGELESAVAAAGGTPRQRQRADLSALWQDFVAAALTLVDAGNRVDGLGPLEIGSSRGVVGSVDDVVPGRAAAFEGLPPHLAAVVGRPQVRAQDVLAVDLLQRRLQDAAADPALALDAGRSEQRLREWHQRYRGSFAVQVGRRIAGALADRRAELVALLRRLADASGAGEEAQDERQRQRRLSRLLRIIVVCAVLIALVAVVLGVIGTVLLPIGIGVAVVVLAAGLASALVLFVKGQRRLFAELNRRQQAVAQAEIDRKNLIEALADVRRLNDAYREFLAWSQATGAFLAAPFGPVPGMADSAARLAVGFPRCARIGVAQADDGQLAAAAAQLRRRTFTVGWLADPWSALLEDAGNRIGPEGFDIAHEPALLFGQPAGNGSLLTNWAGAVDAAGPGSTSGDRFWAGLVQQLQGPWADIGGPLLSHIASTDSGQLPEDLAWFVAGADRPGVHPGSGYFDDVVLTAEARTAGKAAVVTAVGARSTAGLGLVTTVTEFSEGIPPYELTFASAESAVPEPVSAPGAERDDSADRPADPLSPLYDQAF